MVMERNPSCDEGACSITSQTRALSSLSSSGAKSNNGGGTVFGKKPVYAPSAKTVLAAYGQPTLRLDNPHPAPAGAVTEFFGGYSDQAPRFVPAGAVDVVRPAGESQQPISLIPAAQVVIPPAGLAIVRPAGQTPPASSTTAPNPGTKTAGSEAQINYTNAQAPQQQPGGVQMDAQTASALAGLGSSLLQGTRDIVVAAITQGGESDRARARAQAEQEIARLRAQGLLTQDQAALAMQNTNTLLASQQQAALAAALAAQQQPQGFFASMTTPQKVALGVGSAVLVGGLGFAIWRATRD